MYLGTLLNVLLTVVVPYGLCGSAKAGTVPFGVYFFLHVLAPPIFLLSSRIL